MDDQLFWARQRKRRFGEERVYKDKNLIKRSAVFEDMLEQRIFTGMRFFVFMRLAVMAIRAARFGRTNNTMAAGVVDVYG